MRTWQFVCFVGTANYKAFAEIDKFSSKIFFVAMNKQNRRYRILVIRLDPWSHGIKQDDFGKVDCLQTAEFKLPPEPLNELKKVELLVGSSEAGDELMYLIFQYETSLWSVCVSSENNPKRLLPGGEIEMNKRYVIRNKTMEDCLYCLAYKSDSEDNKVVKITIAGDEVIVTPEFIPQSSKLIALEIDPEDNESLYVLDDEQKLTRLNITIDGKLALEMSFDLSVHNIEDLLESFKAKSNCKAEKKDS